jgi:hypothetical protein
MLPRQVGDESSQSNRRNFKHLEEPSASDSHLDREACPANRRIHSLVCSVFSLVFQPRMAFESR